jgi:hypothetical protein
MRIVEASAEIYLAIGLFVVSFVGRRLLCR